MSDIKYNFDKVIDRHGTGCVKFDSMKEHFGTADATPLWVADMDFEVCPAIQKAIEKRISHPVYGYSAVPESFWNSIIHWLSHRYGLTVGREELTYIPGIVRGIGLAINFLTEKGDKILIQPPVYHPFKNLTLGNERTIIENPLSRTETGYRMDLAALEETVRKEKPKMMILCNPHNPGGVQWDADTLREVAWIAKRHSMIVVSDEIHGDLMLDGKKHISFPTVSKEAEEVSIVFGAPSKTFNIAGLVSSWAVIKNKELREPFFHWLETNEFSSPTFFATVSTEAAYNEGEQWLSEVIRYIEGNVDAVDDFFKKNLPEIKVMRPDASFLVWLDCRQLSLDHQGLLDLFVKEAKLALNDGAMFGKEGDGYMRLNVGCSREYLINPLKRLIRK